MRITIKTLLLVIGLLVVGLLLGTTQINAQTEEVIYKTTETTIPVTYRNTTTQVTRSTSYNYRVQEMRAVWVPTVTGDIAAQNDSSITEINAYKNRMLFIFNKMEELGMNTMIYQVRPMNDATYPSEYSPWSSYLIKTTTDPGWDPLEWIIEEAHSRGIELHAWMNPYRLTSATTSAHGMTKEQFAATIPSYNIASNPANIYKYYASSTTSGFALNPGLPAVREFINNVVEELVTNYNLDAIHMDDYFYYKFDSASGGSSDNRLDDADYQTFLAYQGSFPNTSAGIADWRREQTSLLVQGISNVIKNYNEENDTAIQFGISPTGIYRNGTGTVESGSNTAGQEHYQSYLYADSKRWIESNWLDYIMPQTYWGFEHTVAGYADVVDWWVKVVNRPGIQVNLIAAHGIYRALPTAVYDWDGKINETQNELLFLSKHNTIKGSSFYTFGTFRNTTNQVVQNGVTNIKEYWAKKVPGPALQRYPDVTTPAPTNFNAQNELSGVSLTWDKVEGARGYLIYRVPMATTIDFNNQSHILSYVVDSESFLDSGTQIANYRYYVKSVSRANNLSTAVQPENVVWPMPTKLNLASRTDTSITLETQENSEYSMNGVNYQSSPTFTNLAPNTSYAFYIRRKATDTVLASDYFYQTFSTTKSEQSAPTSVDISVYGNQITIIPLVNAEYSLNGTTYTNTISYTNLDILANYTIYVRYKETTNQLPSSPFTTTVQTQKWPTDAPENVTYDVTHDTITIVNNAEFEYSLDGVVYQSSHVFGDLSVYTDYTAYVRYKETPTTMVSEDYLLHIKTRKISVSAPSDIEADVTDNTITITPLENAEYSIDGINWSQVTTYDQLLPMTEYVVSIRFMETGGTYSSAITQKTITTQKMATSGPVSINYQTFFDRIVFVQFSDMEYSMNEVDYQTSSTFEGLDANTSYVFYVRYKETEFANPSSVLMLEIKSAKIKNSTPIDVETIVYGNTITVIGTGSPALEYSLDGIAYQSTAYFSGLESKKNYDVYVRNIETEDLGPSIPLILEVRIERLFQETPTEPTIKVTTNSIRIISIPGYEYSFDEINWTRVTFYRDLIPDTTYLLYVRIAQNSSYEASEVITVEAKTEAESNNAATIAIAAVSAPIAIGGIGFGVFKLFKRRTI